MKTIVIMSIAVLGCHLFSASPVVTLGVLSAATLLSVGSLLTWLID